MRRNLLLCAVPIIGLAGLLLMPQNAQAQRFWAGPRYGVGFDRGYYDYPYGWYGYYPNYGHSYYANDGYNGPLYRWDYPMQSNSFNAEGQGQQPIVYDANGQAWEVPAETAQQNHAQLIFLKVRVPQDARVWIDNQETRQRGSDRMFVSPPVTPGRNCTYQVKAQWRDPDGREVTRTQNVTVQAGQITPVDMMSAPQAAPQLPAQRQTAQPPAAPTPPSNP